MSVDTSLITFTQRSTEPALLHPIRVTSGGLPATDLERARRFHEEVLGLPVEQPDPDHLVVSSGHGHTYIIEHVDAIEQAMVVLNHNGLVVDPDHMSVDEAYARLVDVKDEYGLGAIGKPTNQHGSYSFYFQDPDGNWWEIENQGPFDRPLQDLTGLPDMTPEEARSHMAAMSQGSPGRDDASSADRPATAATGSGNGAALAVREISHGTLESFGLQESRRFYEEVLGLTVYQYTPVSVQIIDHGHMYVAVHAPNAQCSLTWEMRNRLMFETEAEVDEAHETIERIAGEYGVRSVGALERQPDLYSFGLEDRDGNWWELGCESSAAG